MPLSNETYALFVEIFISQLHHNFVLENFLLIIRPRKFRPQKAGRIVCPLFSGQIFSADFRPQDEIIWPGMAFRPLDEQALISFSLLAH